MDDWTNRWAGSYTFTSCGYWGPQYLNTLTRILGRGFGATLFIHKSGTVSFFVKQRELDDLGNALVRMVVEDRPRALGLLAALKANTDTLLGLMQALKGKIPSPAAYREFLVPFERHLAYHVFMKKTVDYLPPDLLGELMPAFREARVYSESVYSKTEEFFRALADAIGKREGVDPPLLTCLLPEEIERYLTQQSLPDRSMLRDRYSLSVIHCEAGNREILTGSAAAEMVQQVRGEIAGITSVRGATAYIGNARGRCRIIMDPFAEVDFAEGDILVTGMTRPEFVRFYDKAAAIVTDAGGMLCHAALIARELKKPCVVGTARATIVFADGDLIEVDATQGTVKKVQK